MSICIVLPRFCLSQSDDRPTPGTPAPWAWATPGPCPPLALAAPLLYSTGNIWCLYCSRRGGARCARYSSSPSRSPQPLASGNVRLYYAQVVNTRAWPELAPAAPSLKMPPVPRAMPSADKEMEWPNQSPAASPSMSDPVCVPAEWYTRTWPAPFPLPRAGRRPC